MAPEELIGEIARYAADKKALDVVELVTCTLSSALITSVSAGTGTPGPISSESWMLPAI